MLAHSNPEVAKRLLEEAQQDVNDKFKYLEYLAAMPAGEAPETKS
jgi:ABC-type transport system substrate-binding protein